MAEFDTSQIGYMLNIRGEYHNTLDIECFSQMMKDPSYCYKFYWLEAIVHIISENIQNTTFDAIIDEMICNAWYSVREFHICRIKRAFCKCIQSGDKKCDSRVSRRVENI